MLKVLYSYAGWQNVNYVMNDVKNPVRTLKIAGPLALGITATLYIFANIAYFAYVHIRTSKNNDPQTPRREPLSVSSKSDILESGTTVASLFFENVFGAQAQKALTVFVALRCILRALLRILLMGRITVHWGERH
jgi:amino acid transporter